MSTIDPSAIDACTEQLRREAEESGYYLHPDAAFVRDLAEGLLVNEQRFGYRACPCRLVSGDREADLDIVCPCDYRDPDLDEFGACYCALYVSKAIANGEGEATPIPERRPDTPPPSTKPVPVPAQTAELAYPVWRCKVCGYLCARNTPPLQCPICKVSKERFERFM